MAEISSSTARLARWKTPRKSRTISIKSSSRSNTDSSSDLPGGFLSAVARECEFYGGKRTIDRRGFEPDPTPWLLKARPFELVFRGEGVRIHGIHTAPQGLQAALGRTERTKHSGVILAREPSAPSVAVTHIGFFMRRKIGKRARLCDVVEEAQPQ